MPVPTQSKHNKVFLNKGLAGLFFLGVERVNLGDLGYERRLKVNGMVIGAMGGRISYVFSENTSSKSLHHSGNEISEVLASWASWVDRVILWIDSSNGSS